MSTITIPSPDITTDDVSTALRTGLGPRYHVLPGMRTSRLIPGKPDPGGPDSILVGAGSDRVRRVQLQVDRSGGQTRIRVEPAGLSWLRLINTVGIGRRVRRALVTAPGLGSAQNPN